MAVTGVSALLIGALSVGLATAARAAHAGSASRSRYVAKVAVLPGQSLWSVALAYDPNADPRLVIAEIKQLNSMAGDQVQAGQVLWVPRD
jgi:LysM repeat protein